MSTAENTQYHDIVEHNIAVYSKELADRVRDGWAISKTNPGDVVGFNCFAVSLYRNAETVKRAKEQAEAIAEAPKPDRSAILAKARAAKADKAQKPG